jgi:hypothetical protein
VGSGNDDEMLFEDDPMTDEQVEQMVEGLADLIDPEGQRQLPEDSVKRPVKDPREPAEEPPEE